MLTGMNPFDHAINRLSKRLLFCFSFLGPKNQRLAFEAREKRAGLEVSVDLCLCLVIPMIANEGKLKFVSVTDCAVRAAVFLCVELRGQPSLGATEWFVHLRPVRGGMKVVESCRFEIPFSSG